MAKSRIKGIADRCQDMSSVGCDRLTHDRVVACNGMLHRLTMVLSTCGAALNVGQEKGHDADRPISHGWLQVWYNGARPLSNLRQPLRLQPLGCQSILQPALPQPVVVSRDRG